MGRLPYGGLVLLPGDGSLVGVGAAPTTPPFSPLCTPPDGKIWRAFHSHVRARIPAPPVSVPSKKFRRELLACCCAIAYLLCCCVGRLLPGPDLTLPWLLWVFCM